MTASLGLDSILQEIQKSTEKQQQLEQEQNGYLGQLTKLSEQTRTQGSSSTYQEDISSIQSKLREIERKINLENAHYEELMLELSLKKKEVNKGQSGSQQHQLQQQSSQDLGDRKDEYNNNDRYKLSDEVSLLRGLSSDQESYLFGPPHQLMSKFPRFEETSDTSIDVNFLNDEMKLRNLENMYKRNDPIIGYSGEETSGLESSYTSPSVVHKDFIDQYLNKLSYLPGDVITNSEPAFSMGLPPNMSTATTMPMTFGLSTYPSTTLMDDFIADPYNHVHHEPSVDMLEIPGKGRCFVYFARYNYDPLQQSLNDNPETELYINKGDYILVWGETDEDGYLEGELLDGRKGLVPSNLIERLTGDDLLEFHQSCVLGVQQEEDVWSTMVPSNLPMDYGAGDTSSPIEEPMPYQYIEDDHLLNATYYSPDLEERHIMEHSSTNFGGLLVQNESPTHLDTASSAVPAPRQLTLERQLNKSILIGWTPPDCPPGHIEMYHVYVDGFLRTTVRAHDKTKALVEGVDSARPHRISVRSVTVNRKTSKDAACTMIIGKDAPLGPSCVRASNITATSCVISWLPSNSNFQHTVCINNVEVRTVKPGVYKHTITGLTPNTTYKVTVRAKNIKASPFVDEKSLSRLLEKLSAHTEFRTLNKALPDPPMDVRVDGGPQDGTILVTWIPVSLNTTAMTTSTKHVPVTGYAVFADGKRVTDVDSPTSDHALVDLGCIGHFNPKLITVRSKSGDMLSNDSSAVPIVGGSRKRQMRAGDPRIRYGNGYRGTGIRSISKPRSLRGFRDASGQLVLDPDEENLSEKELYARNIPAIEITRDSAGSELELYSDEDYDSGRGRMGRRPGGYQGGMQARRRRQQGARDGSRIFVALFDYDPPTMSPNPEACDEELPFREGQLIKIIGEKDADGFYWGECGNRSGYVPCNMVSEVQVDDERLVRDLLKEERGVGGRGGHGRQMGGPRDRWGDIYSNAPVKKMIALYDYDPQELSPNVDAEVELAFRTGDVISVFGDMDDDGFYLAELRGQRGLVPSNFLTEAPNQGRGLGASGASGPPPPPRGAMAGKKAEPPKQETKGGTTPLGGIGGTISNLFSSKPKPPPEPEVKPPEPAKPVEINLDRIPGLDDDFFEEPKKPAAGAAAANRLGAAGARPGAAGAAAQPEQAGGLLGGLTSGLTSGISGLAGGASGVTGKLGDIGGSAAGAAGSLLSGGKGLFKKFGF